MPAIPIVMFTNLAGALLDVYKRQECRLIYTRVPSPRKMHTGAGLEAAVEVAKLESGARLRLHGAHEGAHDLAVDLGRDRVHVDVLAGEKFAGVFHAVDSGRLDLDVFESGLLKFVAVLGVFEGAGNACLLYTSSLTTSKVS